MKVLDRGEIKLIGFMGGDLAVVAAARVSGDVSYEDASKGPEKDQKLISYLMQHDHGTPFEHSVFQFYVKCPIFVAREWFRHRIASYNEVSGRYSVMKPEFYIPATIRIQAEKNRQSSVNSDNVFLNAHAKYEIGQHSQEAFDRYQALLDMGVAREMARLVLPLNTYTRFYFTVNARSLMNFMKLRSAEDAQWEIRQYSLAIENIFKEKMPMTYGAFNEARND